MDKIPGMEDAEIKFFEGDGIILEFSPPKIPKELRKMGVFPAVIFTEIQQVSQELRDKATAFKDRGFKVRFYRAKVKQHHSPTLDLNTVEIVERGEELS